ncbi:MAG: hypothetical protein AAGA18_14625 [Verrucomicrobiota bacterium]
MKYYLTIILWALTMTSNWGLDLNPADGYSDVWVRELNDGVVDADTFDEDGDGISFREEHDYGLDPEVANPDFFVIKWKNLPPLKLVIELQDVESVIYNIEVSNDLATWSLPAPLSNIIGNGNTPFSVEVDTTSSESFLGVLGIGFVDSNDGDLLNDYEEYLIGTNKTKASSDSDQLLDHWEWLYQVSDPRFDPLDGDSDGNARADHMDDFDGDLRSNLDEMLQNTDPHDAGDFATEINDTSNLAHYELYTPIH